MTVLVLLMLVAPLMAANSSKVLQVLSKQMCSDLCVSGLGGAPCGELCSEDVGFNLRTHLQQYSLATARKEDIYGPRRSLCPLLCLNNLGDPLCACQVSSAMMTKPVDWPAICDSFCQVEGYTLYGCPRCMLRPAGHRVQQTSSRVLDKQGDLDIDWEDLCAYLCSKGEGGAACNCDAVP